MDIFFALIIVIFAGFINGSFAFPLKHIKKWNDETIWFMFSFISFLILPIFTLFLMVPNAVDIIYTIPAPIITLLILGGLAFGIGQACYSYSFKLIGIGLNCVINISIGTTSTALLGLVLKPLLIGSLYSYLQIIGIIVFITALILGVLAGKKRVLANIKHKEIGSSYNVTML
jgi:L-rhamnose-H+ transport protein